MLKKNERITLRIDENISLSKSLANAGGKKIIIDGGYEGQKAELIITKTRGQRIEAAVANVTEKAPYQIDAKCAHFGKCGGCRFQDVPYGIQMQWKEQYVRALFDKAAVPYEEFEHILPSPAIWNYKNKMEFSFGDEIKDGPLTLGMHAKRRHFSVVETRRCEISPQDFSIIRKHVQNYFAQNNFAFYNKIKRQGFLRHLVLRHSVAHNKTLVNLVTTSGATLDKTSFAEMLLRLPLQGGIAGILHTTNDSFSDAVAADKTEVLYGDDFLTEELCGLTFKISPFSFFQTNTRGAEVLYRKVLEYAAKSNHESVFDLYCGTGTIAQLAARSAKVVYGIEIMPEAVEAAGQNALINGLTNCFFLCGDVLNQVTALKQKPDLIILDPPRAGMHTKAIANVLSFAPGRLIYISCKATSLMKELPVFMAAGYKIAGVCPVDLFPHTEHVETVVLMTKI